MGDADRESAAGEVQQLRRALRDVVALSMLPSVWAGSEPGQICSEVVEVVARMVSADGTYLLAPSAIEGGVLRVAGDTHGEIEGALKRAAAGNEYASPVRTFVCAMGFGSNEKLIVASRRPDFPTETEKLLIRVITNQASIWLAWKRDQNALAAESAYRKAIEDSMLAGVAVVDATGRQTYVNRAFATMVGWDASELIGGTPPFPYWDPEDGANIERAFSEVIAGMANPSGYELVFRRKNGETFDALVLISPLRQPGGDGAYLASIHDITERKAGERAARFLAEAGDVLNASLDYEETLRAVSTLAVPRVADWCFVDLVGQDGMINRIALAAADPADAQLARRLQRSFGPNNTLHGALRTVERQATALVNDVPRALLESVAADADHLDALLSIGVRCFIAVPMTSRGTTFGVITLVGTRTRARFTPRDVELAEELARRAAMAIENARLYREAQEANHAKDEFLASLSHELRTPMTAILGWAHLLQQGDLEEDQFDVGLATIRQSGEAQARLIDELLDVSRIIAGKLQLSMKVVSLADVLRAAVTAARPAAEARRQSLDLRIDENAAPVLADSDRLRQVFWNLLSNAVKFTPVGGAIRVVLGDQGSDKVAVTVEDNGEGVPPDTLPHVFERFRQAAGTRVRGGLGLGLSIAKELVEMHGGSITAKSEGPGRGSAFTIVLPRHRAEDERSEATPHPRMAARDRLRSIRVLVVEDDDSIRELMATALRHFGADVVDAASAAGAETVLGAANPDVLITDLQMPGEDGIELLRRVRAAGYPRLPAIAVTAFADAATRERIREGGFDGYIAKPFDPAGLADEILRAMQRG